MPHVPSITTLMVVIGIPILALWWLLNMFQWRHMPMDEISDAPKYSWNHLCGIIRVGSLYIWFGQNVMGRHSPSLVTWWWSPRRGWHSTLVSWASIHKTFPCFNPSFTKFANFFRSRQGRRSELAYLFASTVGYVCIHVPRSLYSERFMNALCSRPSLGKESPLVWSKSSGYRAVIDLATTPCSVHHLESFTILKGWQVPYVMAAGTMILSRVLLRCFRHALNPADEAHFRE